MTTMKTTTITTDNHNQTRMTTTTSDSNKEGPDDAIRIVWALWYVFFNELIYYLLTESVFR